MIEEKRFSSFSISEMLGEEGFACSCGRRHATKVRAIAAEGGALELLPALLRERGAARPFILEDANTGAAAGGRETAGRGGNFGVLFNREVSLPVVLTVSLIFCGVSWDMAHPCAREKPRRC